MPELPEVLLMTRRLARAAAGGPLERIDLPDPQALIGDPSPLLGAHLSRVWRRGKLILAATESHALQIHPRMTGQLLPPEHCRRPPRAVLRFAHGAHLAFEDTRRLGRLEVMPLPSLTQQLTRLGPEPWPQRRDGGWWADRLRGRRGALKTTLMDGKVVAGLGNIQVAEALWLAELDPFQPAGTLPEIALERLAVGVHHTIARTLAAEEGRPIHYTTEGGPNPFLVYGREGEPCPRCSVLLARRAQSGRSTFFCPRCQGPR